MRKIPKAPRQSINKVDAFSSATISGVLTFTLLTLSKNIDPNHWLAPYLTDQLISFIAGAGSFILTFVFSMIRFEVSFALHKRNYTKKIDFLDGIIEQTTCSKEREKFEQMKNEVLSEAANSALQEKM